MAQYPFFVYGTLLPGQPNEHFWQDAVAGQEPAVFKDGRLYDMGFYPMLIEEPDSEVKGMLITIDPLRYDEILAEIDRLEGYDPAEPDAPGYRRIRRPVRALESEQEMNAWVYAGRPVALAAGRLAIPGGDWQAYSAQNGDEIAGWWSGIDSILGRHG